MIRSMALVSIPSTSWNIVPRSPASAAAAKLTSLEVMSAMHVMPDWIASSAPSLAEAAQSSGVSPSLRLITCSFQGV